jgi:hypothetical protein
MRGEARVNDRRVLKANLRFCVRCAVARSAGAFWLPHCLLESLCSPAQGWHMASAHECVDRETTPQTLANFGAGTLAAFRRWEYGFTK